MSKYTAIIYCETCANELARIEAKDKPINEPDVFAPQMAEMMKRIQDTKFILSGLQR